jgi:hypothetical protein
MIYPQKNGAMKLFNFIGNSFFASFLVYYLKKKLQIHYVVLKFL